MTPEQTQRLEEIRARAAARTPEEWRWQMGDFGLHHSIRGDRGRFVASQIANLHDAEFIANAPSDIDTLLALVEAYAGALDYAREQIVAMWEQDDPKGRRPSYVAAIGAIDYAEKKYGLAKLP